MDLFLYDDLEYFILYCDAWHTWILNYKNKLTSIIAKLITSTCFISVYYFPLLLNSSNYISNIFYYFISCLKRPKYIVYNKNNSLLFVYFSKNLQSMWRKQVPFYAEKKIYIYYTFVDCTVSEVIFNEIKNLSMRSNLYEKMAKSSITPCFVIWNKRKNKPRDHPCFSSKNSKYFLFCC